MNCRVRAERSPGQLVPDHDDGRAKLLVRGLQETDEVVFPQAFRFAFATAVDDLALRSRPRMPGR
jgi:hypothetical protein